MLLFLLRSSCSEAFGRKSWCVPHTEAEGSCSPCWEQRIGVSCLRAFWLKICPSPPIIHLLCHFQYDVVYIYLTLWAIIQHRLLVNHPSSGTWGHQLAPVCRPPSMWSFGCYWFWVFFFSALNCIFSPEDALSSSCILSGIIHKSHKTGFHLYYIHKS